MAWFGRRTVRTGIDLGTVSVKLVRGRGSPWLEEITHVGAADWDFFGATDDVDRAARGLQKLLDKLKLHKSQLGRVAVAVPGQDASFREVVMPRLEPDELDRALPYEARKHLDIEGMEAPILASQILGPVTVEDDEEGRRMRVLLAAVPRAQRDFPLQVLEKVGLEAEIVTLEPLVGLNALLTDVLRGGWEGEAMGLLDLGGRRASLHITRSTGSLLSRVVGPGAPPKGQSERLAPLEVRLAPYLETLVERVRETVTFYRGRFRKDLKLIYLSGGGALFPGILEALTAGLDVPVTLLDPLERFTDRDQDLKQAAAGGVRFVTALGLCRWWDVEHVPDQPLS